MNKVFISVFRNAEFEARGCDCSANGLSHRVNSGWLFWNCSSEEAIQNCNDNGIDPNLQFIIHERTLWGEDHSFAEPLVKPVGLQMFGGNFLYTSNCNCFKFGKETTCRPIPIHDRFESQEEYNALSI